MLGNIHSVMGNIPGNDVLCWDQADPTHSFLPTAPPPQAAAPKNAFFPHSHPDFATFPVFHPLPPPPSLHRQEPLMADQEHSSPALFPFSLCPRRWISPLTPGVGICWIFQDTETWDLQDVPGDEALLLPTPLSPPGWSPCLTFLPPGFPIIPCLGCLRGCCCNFCEWLRDWEGSEFLH